MGSVCGARLRAHLRYIGFRMVNGILRALLIAAVAHTHTGSWAGRSARLYVAATAGPSSPSRRQALTTTYTTTITKHRTMIERAACSPAHSCTGCWAGGFVCHRSAAFTGWSSSAKGRTLTTTFTHTTKPCGTMLQQSTHSALHRALCNGFMRCP